MPCCDGRLLFEEGTADFECLLYCMGGGGCWGGGFILVANSGTNGLLRTAGGVMEAPSLSWSDLSSSGTGGRGTPLPLEKKSIWIEKLFSKSLPV